MATKREMADRFEAHRRLLRKGWEPDYWNLAASMVITTCVAGIVVGAGVDLPAYSWVCIGTLIGLVNPVGKS